MQKSKCVRKAKCAFIWVCCLLALTLLLWLLEADSSHNPHYLTAEDTVQGGRTISSSHSGMVTAPHQYRHAAVNNSTNNKKLHQVEGIPITHDELRQLRDDVKALFVESQQRTPLSAAAASAQQNKKGATSKGPIKTINRRRLIEGPSLLEAVWEFLDARQPQHQQNKHRKSFATARAESRDAQTATGSSRPPTFEVNDNANKHKKNGFGWQFVRYVPSDMERDWLAAVKPMERLGTFSSLRAKFKPAFEKYVQQLRFAVHPEPRLRAEYAANCVEYLLRNVNKNVVVREDAPLAQERKQHEQEAIPPPLHLNSTAAPFDRDPIAFERRKISEDAEASTTTTTATAADFDPAVFSRFDYEFGCIDDGEVDPDRSCDPTLLHTTWPSSSPPAIGDRHVSYIEPLVGLLRHPNVFLHTPQHIALQDVLNKQYMFVDQWALHHLGYRWQSLHRFEALHEEQHQRQQTRKRTTRRRRRRALYFDLGASQYSSGMGGSSQDWFVSLMESLCIGPTALYLWEASPIDHAQLFQELPGPLRPLYHYYNIPLEVELDSWNNPLNTLLLVSPPLSSSGDDFMRNNTQQNKSDTNTTSSHHHHDPPSRRRLYHDDVVFWKMDFDNHTLEAALVDQILTPFDVEQILTFPELSSRVDEFFFEHHVNLPVMEYIWGDTANMELYASDSIRLFQRLRSQRDSCAFLGMKKKREAIVRVSL